MNNRLRNEYLRRIIENEIVSGTGMYSDMDDSMYGRGVLYDGGIGKSAKSKAAAKKNPWLKFLKGYIRDYKDEFSDYRTLVSAAASVYNPTKKRVVKKVSAKVKKSMSKKPKKLTSAQMKRIGQRFNFRAKNPRNPKKPICKKQNSKGPFFLDEDYDCENVQDFFIPKYNAKKKK